MTPIEGIAPLRHTLALNDSARSYKFPGKVTGTTVFVLVCSCGDDFRGWSVEEAIDKWVLHEQAAR